MIPLSHLSLRLRIFLFFALLGLGGVVLLGVGLWFGYRQLGDPQAGGAFLLAGAVGAFAILGLSAGIWMLFDDHVARPLQALAAELRARTHGDVRIEMDDRMAQHLGDLAPAAAAVTNTLAETRSALAEAVARETAALNRDATRLGALIAELPEGVMFCKPDHRVILYNARARAALGAPAGLGLNRPLGDILDLDPITRAYAWLRDPQTPDMADLATTVAGAALNLRMRLIRQHETEAEFDTPGYLLMFAPSEDDIPATDRIDYDFDLLGQDLPSDLVETPLMRLDLVVFDTETTGLNPERDEICQIAACRVVNGRVRVSEPFDQLVNPGRPIPAASTKVHGIRDVDVADAPTVPKALTDFHSFAGGTVLVAHNAPFDMGFVQRREREIGRKFDQPILDTVLFSAILYGAAADHTLDALCDRLGITIPEAERHTALGDARATALAVTRMLPMLEARGIVKLGELIAEFDQHTRVISHLN